MGSNHLDRTNERTPLVLKKDPSDLSQLLTANKIWLNALTLSERAAFLNRDSRKDELIYSEYTQHRFQKWKADLLFSDDRSVFDEFLTSAGLEENSFKYLLSESAVETLACTEYHPEWLTNLVNAFSSFPESFPQSQSVEELSKVALPEFGLLIAPLVLDGRKRLRKGVQKIMATAVVPWDMETIEKILFSNLLGRLAGVLNRTLVLELHVARLQGHLNGNTPEER